MLTLQLNPKKKPTSLEIKSSYKKLALKYHPDSIQSKSDSKDTSHKFSEVTDAYNYLIEQHSCNFIDHIFDDELRDASDNSTEDKISLSGIKDPVAYKKKRDEFIQKMKFDKYMSVALKQNEIRLRESQARAEAEEEAEKKKIISQEATKEKEIPIIQEDFITRNYLKFKTAINERKEQKILQLRIKMANIHNFEKLTQQPIKPFKVVVNSFDDPIKINEATELFTNSQMNSEQEEVYKALRSKADYDNFYKKLNK